MVWDGFWVSEDFGPGTYYVKITTPRGYTGHPVPYTALYFVDETYTEVHRGLRSKNAIR